MKAFGTLVFKALVIATAFAGVGLILGPLMPVDTWEPDSGLVR